MRTTLTLDEDVTAALRREMRRSQTSLKAVVNEALRRGLDIDRTPLRPHYVVQAHAFGLRSVIDPGRINQLVDDLESEEVARKLAQP